MKVRNGPIQEFTKKSRETKENISISIYKWNFTDKIFMIKNTAL
jgi:hypothetical protein